MRPRIAIFFTGGTICMRQDARAGGAVPALSGEDIVAQTPGLTDVAECEIIDFARLPGPHVTPAHMLALARAVADRLADPAVAGAVVTHGTDTLEETAFLLDLVLAGDKPVAFVGALRPHSDPGWDGPRNLLAAARVAAEPAVRGLGVLVVMNDLILAAAEASKTHTDAPDTFQSRDFGPLGVVERDRVLVACRPARRQHVPADRVEERVPIVTLPAGADGRFIDFALADGARGLVVEALGRGNVPVGAAAALARAAREIPVVITSRCPHGRVLDTYAYEGAGRHLTRCGAILGGLLPAHKARIKLMLLLGAGRDGEAIRQSFEA